MRRGDRGTSAEYWDEVERRVGVLTSLASARLDAAANRAHSQRRTLGAAVRHQLERRSTEIEVASDRVVRMASSIVASEAVRTRNRVTALGDAAQRAVGASGTRWSAVRACSEPSIPDASWNEGGA